MKKKPVSYVLVLLSVLILLVVVMFAQGSIRRSGHITLPDLDRLQDQGESHTQEERLELLEVRQDTVQQVVASMDRADAYTMTIQVETLWSGGSGTATLTAYVRDGWTRVDTLQLDGSVRRTLSDGTVTYIWYDNETEYLTLSAGETTADRELRIPTYETLVELDPETILDAGYQELKGVYCIYAEAREGEDYISRYWVEVDSGLLIAAQRLWQMEPVYQMTVQSMDLAEPDISLFTLPDGQTLLREGKLAFAAET